MDVSPLLIALASWAGFAGVYGAGAALCVRGIDPRRVVVMESAVTAAGCAALSAFLLFAFSGFGCLTDTNDDRAYCDDGGEQDQLFWGLLTLPLVSLAFLVVGAYLNRGEDEGRGLYTTMAVITSIVAPFLLLNAVAD